MAVRPPISVSPDAPGHAQSPLLGSNPLAAAAVATSTGLGGYASDPAEGFASVTTTFQVPQITCQDANNVYDLWWGDFLTPANSGTAGWHNGWAGYAAVYAECYFGVPSDYAYAGAGPYRNHFQINPGDTVVARIADTNTGEVIAQLTDLTLNGSIFSAAIESGDPEYQVGSFPNGTNELPVFTKVTFKNSFVNGAYMNQPSQPTPYTLSLNGDAQVVPSTISKTKPVNTFTDTEKSPF
jgi:hypothetical protein